MQKSAINFQDKLAKIHEHWSPRNVAQLNDYRFKLVKIEGDFVWHSHPDTDEAFIVIEGEIGIDLPDGPVTLKSGEMFVVSKGVEHKPFAKTEAKLLLIEPEGTPNTGDAGGERTASEDEWI